MRASTAVFVKELTDAMRDRRTLLMVLLSSVAVGPVILLLFSSLIGSIEQRAEERVVFVQGAAFAPTLVNYLQRQNLNVKDAPTDHEALLRQSKFDDAVIRVPEDFEAQLARGDAPTVEVFTSSANNRSRAGAGRAIRALRSFSQEHATLRMLARGVAPTTLDSALEIEERDLSGRQASAAQFGNTVPFFVLMAVLYGALTAALDATAGERERGSLEPLLMTPAKRESIVMGKWAAVAAVGMLIALLSCLSFLPAQYLIRSESMSAMFQYGWREAGAFLLLLLPFGAAMSALLMAVAIRSKTFKEAQASNTIVILLVTMLPMVQVFGQQGESRWHLWVPALGQTTLMNRVLKGEAVPLVDLLVPLGSCFLIAGLCLAYVAHTLKHAALR